MTAARSRYVRTALTPRMLGLLAVLLAIAAVCARLGVWQLDRAQRAAPDDAGAASAVPLADVLAPQATFTGAADGRLVEVRGEFGPDEVLVGRELAGEMGHLVVTPFVVEGTDATLAVVRGWVAGQDRADAAPPPGGRLTLHGVLQVGEAGGDDAGLPPDEVSAVSPAQLVNRWGGPMYTGYLLLTGPADGPAGAGAGAGLRPVPPPEPARGWDLQNLAYALQWWLFGGFAVLLWARLVRDDARREAPGPPSGLPSGAATPGPAGAGGDATS